MPFKILLTGATGYIGGSVLHQLLTSTHPLLLNSQITILLRGPASRAQPFLDLHLRTLFFSSLDDSPTLTHVASEHDLVIGTTLCYHTPSALAIISSLQHRITAGKFAACTHTDGMSNLGDAPGFESGFSDGNEHIYEAMRAAQAQRVYIQRTISLVVVDAGVQAGVPTYTMMAPMVYGRGSGGRLGGMCGR